MSEENKERNNLVNTLVPEFPQFGPITAPEADHTYTFQVNDEDEYLTVDYWKKILSGVEDVQLGSRFILLPDAKQNLLINIVLESFNEEKFQIRLCSPNIELNRQRQLPVNIRLKVDIFDSAKSFTIYASEEHTFVVDNFEETAEPDDFYIPISELMKSSSIPPVVKVKFIENSEDLH